MGAGDVAHYPPPHSSQVDIIISEWMGYFLLYESMLDTVMFARDKWLVEGGIMLPDKSVLHLCAIEDAEYKAEKIDCEQPPLSACRFPHTALSLYPTVWDSVYGFDMSVIKEIAITEPLVDVVEGKAVVSNSFPILNLDLMTCTKEDCSFTSEFTLSCLRQDFCHAFVAYFEVAFTQLHKPIAFSTGPFSKYTHWKQTVFYLKEPLTICGGEEIQGQISCVPNSKNPRDLDIEINMSFAGRFQSIDQTQSYRLR